MLQSKNKNKQLKQKLRYLNLIIIIIIFVYEETVFNIDFSSDETEEIVSITLCKTDNSKYLFLENG